jgi:8-oxo-dGTP pyrophosphatase MutT (NUDIX family)
MGTRQPAVCSDGERVQCAALPYRVSGGLMVLLQTSRDTGRWVLPKGWPMKGEKPYSAAKREALEEAGVVGPIGRRSIGTFHYPKRLPGGGVVTCEVHVYPLAVESQRKRWRERRERTQQWFTPDEAARMVQEPELAALLRAFMLSDDAEATR